MKKTTKVILAELLVLIIVVLTACGEKRDCEQEYYGLSKCTFSSAAEGANEADEYLKYFKPKKCIYYEDVKEIQQEFLSMDDFFYNHYDKYADFQREAIKQPFYNSRYSTVVNTWKALVENEQHRLLDAIVDRINAADIGSYMLNQVRSICENDYGGNGPFGWEVNGVSSVSLSDLEPIGNNLFGKKCKGIYRASMEGAMGLGLRSGTVKLQIEGGLYVDTYGNLRYQTFDYKYLETTGQVPLK